jgi:site-specific DNA recombinase
MPLRGFLTCPSCGSNLTGSASKGSKGGKYHYYHCNPRKACKERFKVKLVHDKFEELIHNLQSPSEVSELFDLILEEKYREAEKTKLSLFKKSEEEIARIGKMHETLLDKLLDNTIDNETYKKRDIALTLKEAEARSTQSNLRDYDEDMKEHISFGAFVLQNLKDVYTKSPVALKRKLLSSILEENLIFDGEMYRTPKLKEGFNHIYNNVRELGQVKTKTGDNLSKASRLVLEAGLEPARPKGHKILSLACLPIPPLERGILIFSSPS